VISGIAGEKCDLARRFDVINNAITLRSRGNCIAVIDNIPSLRIEGNKCTSINDTLTGTQIVLGTDASPQVPLSSVLVKPDRGIILIRNNRLEQTNTIVPYSIGPGVTNGIDNGHAILIGQGVDYVECSGNTCLGFDNGLVIKGEYNSVHHN